ncbi:hypothetical protein GOODEAATRI_000996 [Goodea atripinnis]|uniref:Uncharacterized protein n=1 Tax=Goodea atripinnis TaxID=208336 RepID=A0ABV0PUD5_9TELE
METKYMSPTVFLVFHPSCVVMIQQAKVYGPCHCFQFICVIQADLRNGHLSQCKGAEHCSFHDLYIYKCSPNNQNVILNLKQGHQNLFCLLLILELISTLLQIKTEKPAAVAKCKKFFFLLKNLLVGTAGVFKTQ